MVLATTTIYTVFMESDLLSLLGLSQNEAKIYETLLEEGECSVSKISKQSGVHRRNVYDNVNRLIEKGLIFQILEESENYYQAVAPSKLRELVDEKIQVLDSALPGLEKLFRASPKKQSVYIYRGVEGWKNYMRDIIRIGEDHYCIGGKGGWLDPRLSGFFKQFTKEAKKKNIKFYHLFDHEIKESNHPILKYTGKHYKFLPKEFSTMAAIDIFGSHVNIISNVNVGEIDKDFTFTVIVNEEVADAFRVWFKFMWSAIK